jgi:hypothetical protein
VIGTERREDILFTISPHPEKLYKLHPEMLRDEILSIPWVKSVRVIRIPTGRLILSVKERIPVAYFRGKEIMGVDRDGMVFPLENIPDDIPEFRGGTYTKDALGWAIEFIKATSISEVTRKIYITKKGPITQWEKFRIVWGKGNYRQKFIAAKYALSLKLDRGTLDMRFNDQIVYRKEVR